MKIYRIIGIAALTALLCGCGVKQEEYSRKIKELEESTQELARTNSEMKKLQVELEQAKSAIEQYQTREKEQKAGDALILKDVEFSDQAGVVTVEILQILTGDEVVQKGKYWARQLDLMRQEGKDIIYFEIKITNNSYNGELRRGGIKLESTNGETFTTLQTRDYLQIFINKGKSARGGIAFALYPDTKPSILRFGTNIVDSRKNPIEVVSPPLEGLISRK